MVIVFFYEDENGKLICDHGIDTETDAIVAMPRIPLSWMGVGDKNTDMIHYDVNIGEYILNEA